MFEGILPRALSGSPFGGTRLHLAHVLAEVLLGNHHWLQLYAELGMAGQVGPVLCEVGLLLLIYKLSCLLLRPGLTAGFSSDLAKSLLLIEELNLSVDCCQSLRPFPDQLGLAVHLEVDEGPDAASFQLGLQYLLQ